VAQGPSTNGKSGTPVKCAASALASAQVQVRPGKLANQVLRIMQKESPNLFGDYREVPLPDGTFEIETNYRKV
jgi:hypothetical protein